MFILLTLAKLWLMGASWKDWSGFERQLDIVHFVYPSHMVDVQAEMNMNGLPNTLSTVTNNKSLVSLLPIFY